MKFYFYSFVIVYSGVYRTQSATEILPADHLDYELEDDIDKMYESLLNEFFYYPHEKEVLWVDIAHDWRS